MPDRRSARQQLDRKYAAHPAGALAVRPKFGWLRAVRDSLGMTTAQLAARVGVTAAAVTQAEHSEQHDAIRLATLKRFANAMDCDVVYYLAPRAGSLDAAVSKRLDAAAEVLSHRVGHTMALEDQSASGADTKRRLRASLDASGKIW